MEQRDHDRGVMAGLAAGDRIGGPLAMARVLQASLAHCQGFDAQDFGTRLLAWWTQGGFDAGRVSAAVFTRVAAGMPFEAAALEVHRVFDGMTAGVNAAHRAAPLAACIAIPDHALASAARAQARLTHLHPEAGDAAAAVVLLCRALIRGHAWPAALVWSRDRLGDAAWMLPVAIPPATHRGGYAPRTLADALWFVDRADSFESALTPALAFAGAENYCPVLVGAIAGARWGMD